MQHAKVLPNVRKNLFSVPSVCLLLAMYTETPPDTRSAPTTNMGMVNTRPRLRLPQNPGCPLIRDAPLIMPTRHLCDRALERVRVRARGGSDCARRSGDRLVPESLRRVYG